jgi:hypothetical protein
MSDDLVGGLVASGCFLVFGMFFFALRMDWLDGFATRFACYFMGHMESSLKPGTCVGCRKKLQPGRKRA